MKQAESSTWRTCIYILGPLLALAMFANKPYHIDDVAYLRASEILPYHFLGDVSGRIEWQGVIYEQLSPYESTHPPLIPYLLKWISLFSSGSNDFRSYHLFFLVIPALAIWLVCKQGAVLGIKRSWLWFLLFSPAFFVNATNLMTDVPLAVFWLGTMLFTLNYAQNRQTRALLGTNLCLILALMTAYQSLCLIPLICLVLHSHGGLRRKDLWLALPILVFTIYLLLVYRITGFFPYLAHNADYHIATLLEQGVDGKKLANKGIALLINTGFALLFATPLLLAQKDEKRKLRQLIGAFASYWMIYQRMELNGYFEQYTAYERAALKIWTCLGSFWIWFVAERAVELGRQIWERAQLPEREEALDLVLSLWFLGVLLYNLILLPMGSSRYLLPALPAALILVYRTVDQAHHKALLPTLLVMASLASMFLARVDEQRARGDYKIYEELARTIEPTEQLYFSDDFGLNRYLNEIGAHYLPMATTQLVAGDLVLMTRDMIPEKIKASLDLIRTIEIPSYKGVVLYDRQNRAGFYNSYDGLLPFNRGTSTRRAHLCQVNYFKANRSGIRIEGERSASLEQRLQDDGSQRGVLYMEPGSQVMVPIKQASRQAMSGQVALDRRRNHGQQAQTQVALEAEWSEGMQLKSCRLWQGKLGHKKERIEFEVSLPDNIEYLRIKTSKGEPVIWSHIKHVH